MRKLILGLMALTLAACASVHRLDAAGDVHALLIAIRDNDTATFDAHVDRPALQQEIEARMMAEAGKDKRLSGLAAMLAPALAKIAGDNLIQPGVFKLVAEHYGYTAQTKIPNQIALTQALKELPDGRVCAVSKKDGPCLLIFTKIDQTWKLTGFEGDTHMLKTGL